MNDPYRVPGLPGDPPSGPDAFLDLGEAELYERWRSSAEDRRKLVAFLKEIRSSPATSVTPAMVASVVAQLAFIDSEMNGVLIVRAFQRLMAQAAKSK